jgi:hypothetical protein
MSLAWRASTSGDGRVFRRLSLRQRGNLSSRERKTASREVKAHRFASPSFDGYALSRMKGVSIQAKAIRLASKIAAKTGKLVCLLQI